MKRVEGAVEKQRYRARTFVSVMDAHSIDFDESGRICRKPGFQLSGR